jgi:hypothetical protein
VPLFPDLSSRAQLLTARRSFGDVDSGGTRWITYCFRTNSRFGVALSIRGFEIDGEDAFENQTPSCFHFDLEG